MTKLRKFNVEQNKKTERWELKNQQGQVIKATDNKADLIAGGVLEKAIGPDGGSVKIRKMDGTIQEERTFPREADPKESPG